MILNVDIPNKNIIFNKMLRIVNRMFSKRVAVIFSGCGVYDGTEI